jgi:DNA-binding GntR family transcriptional regulator
MDAFDTERKSRESATDMVYASIRDKILVLELLPGAMIDKAALCEKFGVSRSPVSEALARLQSDGLVEILPQRGTRVARIRMADLIQSMFLRRVLEVETVRTIAKTISDETISKLSLNIGYQNLAAANNQTGELHRLDVEYHETLIDQLGFQKVKDVIGTATSNLHRVRRLLSTPGQYSDRLLSSPVRHADTIREHKDILSGLQERNPDRAAEAMERHLRTTLDVFLQLASKNPEIVMS